ncbi:6-hydroxymethylpterin diphosphokinase MptE-like protein [Salinibaculum rarum]|uniref:6-hydroxymethylpterin diphosphokinase MptE-like protein n=1 Tax=Salinibaculum rarum TaxID=3058903 RepID=UPI0026605BB5|nr:6-hydroxymethylpterin diphosphokinase MptE-like protein [Salinibaculum sp. KK48]
MDYSTWEPVYTAILSDFGFERAADERARDRLATLLDPAETVAPDNLDFTVDSVAIAGAGPNLEAQADRAATADSVVAASTAADRLEACGVAIDCMVTDLDKNPETVTHLTEAGTPVAVHAHGDNIPALETHVPTFEDSAIVPTTQAAPTDAVYNVGGFTDGDRAAFLADHCGAEELRFVGWDFDDPAVDPMKQKKLVWAERLLLWLERRRDERFAVLDGRRDTIDDTVLPA